MNSLSCAKIRRECVAILINFSWVLRLMAARRSKRKLGDHILSHCIFRLILLVQTHCISSDPHLLMRSLSQGYVLNLDLLNFYFLIDLLGSSLSGAQVLERFTLRVRCFYQLIRLSYWDWAFLTQRYWVPVFMYHIGFATKICAFSRQTRKKLFMLQIR